MEDGWNNFRKTICEVADGILRKKVWTAARNISEKALYVIKMRWGLYKNYLSHTSFESKKNVMKVEKSLKYELKRCEMEAMDKIAEDLEEVATQHKWNSNKILYWHANKMKGSGQSELVPVKDRNGTTISDEERVKVRWAEHFENVLNRDRVAEKDIQENEKVCDTLDVKGDLFCEEELATILKGLKYSKAPGTDNAVKKFLKYDGSEVRNKLLKTMNVISKKVEVPSVFRETLIKPMYKKGHKSECDNYQGVSLV